MKTSTRAGLATAFLLALCTTPASAQFDPEPWDVRRMRSASDCNTLSKTNLVRILGCQVVEQRKVDKMSIPLQQKQRMNYEILQKVQDINRNEERSLEQYRNHFERQR
jgi:hypothetical protein